MKEIKKYIFFIKIIIVSLIIFSFTTPKQAYCWIFHSKSDTELLSDALKSDDATKVDRCLERQIEMKNYTGVLQLKLHAIQMSQKERNRLTGIPGMTSLELAKQLKPWKDIISKADAFTKKRKTDQQQPGQTVN